MTKTKLNIDLYYFLLILENIESCISSNIPNDIRKDLSNLIRKIYDRLFPILPSGACEISLYLEPFTSRCDIC